MTSGHEKEALAKDVYAFPLSFAQQRLWFLDQLEPNRSVYNMPSAFRLKGRLDIPALEQSLNEIVRRHEALRTTFSMVDGEAVQVISPSLVMSVPMLDLSDRFESERENEARRLVHEEALAPFDLSQGPLLRVTLVRLGEQDHVLLLTLHHIVSDGWSMGVLFRELSALYRAYCAGKPSPLPALPIQYVDYAQWQRQRFQSENLVEEIDYWRKQLDGAPRVLELPTDHPRPPIQTYTGARESLFLSTNLSESLRSLGRKQNATLSMTLLAAFSVLLHRHTGENEIVVGSPIAGRNQLEIEGLIGFFLNHLVLRIDLSEDPSFRELLSRVREMAIGAYTHQDLPFERLLEELRPERDSSRTPLFQAYFNMLELEDLRPDLPGITVEPMTRSEPESKFDLTLYIRADKERIRFDLVYNTSIFDRPRMAEMLKQLKHLFSQIIENPETRIERLSMVTADAAPILPNPTSQLNKGWYGAIPDRLAQQARTRPGQLAIVDPWGKWSYKTLDSCSNQLANYLRSGGIQSADIVAIYGHRSAALVCAILGVLKAGAAFLILDPAYPASRVLDCTQQAEPRGWLQLEAAGPLPDPVMEFAETLPSMRRLELPRSSAGISEVVGKFPIDNPGVSVGPDDLAYVSFTSGSTGHPKGILGRHGPLTHFLPWQEEAFRISASDRFSMLSGLSHDPLQRDVFTPLWAGATICIPDPDIIGTPKLANWMAEEAITFAHLTPPMLKMLAETAEPGQRISSLRHVFFVGDRLTHGEVERVRRLSPQVTCIASYGATETQRAVGYHVIAPDSDERNHRSRPEYPLGRGMGDTQLLVLNGERQLAGIGEFGEIYVRSCHLARGYLNDAALTAAKFLNNPFTKDNDDRLYKTGDMGRYLPDGNVEFAGRIDNQVKIRGYRIELGEIESVLAHHSGIRETAVATQQDRAGDLQIIAYIVPQEVAPTTHDLRDYLKAKLPDYMVPSAFVMIDFLPLTPNGKLDRKALPIADLFHRAQGKTYRAPRTPVEEKMAAIWAEVLRVDKVGMDDNFFDLGGHSLLATQAMSRMRAVFNCDIPLRTLFESPTVGDLAKIISVQQAAQVSETEIDRLLEDLEAMSNEDAERTYKGQVTKREE
jgi:amino acid adenylation domain-containing protein